MMKFELRGLLPCDIDFITSTWLSTYKHNAKLGALMIDGLYFSEHNKLIHEALDRSKVIVAHDPEDKEHVFGFLVGESTEAPQGADYLHYIYVKKVFREQGIATKLIERFQEHESLYNTHENLRKGILGTLKRKYKRVIFNPYAFTNPNYLES